MACSRSATSQWLGTQPFVFFFTDTPTPAIYTLSLHDALPIYQLFETFTHHPCPVGHGAEFVERYLARQMHQAAVGVDHQFLGRYDVQRAADAVGDEPCRLDVVRLDVHHTHGQRERHLEFLEQLQVVLAAARELERQRLHVRVEDLRKQIPVRALERRLAVAVAVTDVQGDVRAHAVNECVDRLDRPRQILGKARIVRFVDLQVRDAFAHQLAYLEVHHPRQVERERLFRRVEVVAYPFDQRVRPGN